MLVGQFQLTATPRAKRRFVYVPPDSSREMRRPRRRQATQARHLLSSLKSLFPFPPAGQISFRNSFARMTHRFEQSRRAWSSVEFQDLAAFEQAQTAVMRSAEPVVRRNTDSAAVLPRWRLQSPPGEPRPGQYSRDPLRLRAQLPRRHLW